MSSEEKRRCVVDEKERARLVQEIGRMKEVLDSFRYGLNFEEFANEVLETVDRQTASIKRLQETMDGLANRMDRLETRLEAGIKLRVASHVIGESDRSLGKEVVIEPVPPAVREEVGRSAVSKQERAALEKESGEIRGKIARLFEKESEMVEMQLNDPASAPEYGEKAKVARQMRTEMEHRLKDIESKLDK